MIKVKYIVYQRYVNPENPYDVYRTGDIVEGRIGFCKVKGIVVGSSIHKENVATYKPKKSKYTYLVIKKPLSDEVFYVANVRKLLI